MHDSQTERKIPKEFSLNYVTLDQLVSSAEINTITHMWIEGEIPQALAMIAPNVRWLRLRDLPSMDELERYEKICGSFQERQEII